MVKIMQTFDCNITMPSDSGLSDEHLPHGMPTNAPVNGVVLTYTPTPLPSTHRPHRHSHHLNTWPSSPTVTIILVQSPIYPLTETVIPVTS